MAEIVLGKRSTDYMKEIVGRYTPIAKLPDYIKEKIVIHMYAVGDTTPDDQVDDAEGGFIDALFFDAKIYLTESRTVYTVERRDGINVYCPSEIKIFKDGSTMVIVNTLSDKSLMVSTGQSMSIWSR